MLVLESCQRIPGVSASVLKCSRVSEQEEPDSWAWLELTSALSPVINEEVLDPGVLLLII